MKEIIDNIFNVNAQNFEEVALEVFNYQIQHNSIYRQFADLNGFSQSSITNIDQIPFLPIEFFKSQQIISGDHNYNIAFESSGTTGSNRSKHYVKDIEVYRKSAIQNFNQQYPELKNSPVLALLPSYLERGNASLVRMVKLFMDESNNEFSGFFLDDLEGLIERIEKLEEQKNTYLLIGVSFALLDLLESTTRLKLEHGIVMETGGMKGRRKEMIREELHEKLKQGLNTSFIHSEYGMTELLSQAYRKECSFKPPPWMKALVREADDPFAISGKAGLKGGLNIIDLANIHSCSFIATQDIGEIRHNGFEVLGRFDNTEVRGCNLMI